MMSRFDHLVRINNTDYPWPAGDDTMGLRRRLKIAMYICNANVFNTKSFDDFEDANLMPHILAYLGKKRPSDCEEFDGAYYKMDAIYALLRSWDMPTLYTFPSREKIQLLAEIDKLKKDIESMRKLNEDLVSENRRLQQLESGSSCDEKTSSGKRSKLN